MTESHGYQPPAYPHRIAHEWTRRLTVAEVRALLDLGAQQQYLTHGGAAILSSADLDGLAIDAHASLLDERQSARLMTHGRVRTDGEHVLIDSTDDGAEGADEGGEWWTLIDTTTGDTIDLSTAEAGRLGIEIADDEEAFGGIALAGAQAFEIDDRVRFGDGTTGTVHDTDGVVYVVRLDAGDMRIVGADVLSPIDDEPEA